MKWRRYPRYKPSEVEWLGEIPEHWDVLRLKNVARFGYGDSLAADDRVPGNYFVFGSNGIVGEHERPNTKGPCLIIGRKGSFGKVAFSQQPCFAIDTTYYVDSSLTRHNLRWLFYCLQWLRLDSFSKDSAVPGLSREDSYENILPFCNQNEQHTIATFLDRKTAAIDALIAKKQRQIELLEEKRAALISHAVTKGLDPNVKMKDSGIEWLGEVPAHWEVKQLRRLAHTIKTGGTPKGAEENFFEENGFNWFTPSDFSGNLYLHESTRKLSDQGKQEVRLFPPMTIMMVGIGATIGKVALSKEKCSCNQQINGIVCIDSLNSVFGTYYLRTLRGFIVKCGKFTTMPIINQEETKSLLVVVPPIDEQTAIATFLDRKTSAIDSLIEKIQKSIDFLQEYRTALISAAVTGKIDVRQEAAV